MTSDSRKECFGRSLKRIRLRRGYTQCKLAAMSGLSESAYRSYELGVRFPKIDDRNRIAAALCVQPEALNTSGIAMELAFIHLLFNCEEQFHLDPDERGLGILSSGSRYVAQALEDWGLMRAKLRGGGISEEEYADWKDTYTGRCGSECRAQPCNGGASGH